MFGPWGGDFKISSKSQHYVGRDRGETKIISNKTSKSLSLTRPSIKTYWDQTLTSNVVLLACDGFKNNYFVLCIGFQKHCFVERFLVLVWFCRSVAIFYIYGKEQYCYFIEVGVEYKCKMFLFFFGPMTCFLSFVLSNPMIKKVFLLCSELLWAASQNKDGWSRSCFRSSVRTTTSSPWSFLARKRRWWGPRLVSNRWRCTWFNCDWWTWTWKIHLFSRWGRRGSITGWSTQCPSSGGHFFLNFKLLVIFYFSIIQLNIEYSTGRHVFVNWQFNALTFLRHFYVFAFTYFAFAYILRFISFPLFL